MSESPATLRPPNPKTQLDQEFWAHCAEENLCFQRCTECYRWRHLPRNLCAHCGSDQWEWEPCSGRARLFSWTVSHQAMLPEFRDQVPYVVAIVELEEGVRMVSTLRNVALDELALDLPLQLEFERIDDEMALPVFHPRSG